MPQARWLAYGARRLEEADRGGDLAKNLAVAPYVPKAQDLCLISAPLMTSAVGVASEFILPKGSDTAARTGASSLQWRGGAAPESGAQDPGGT